MKNAILGGGQAAGYRRVWGIPAPLGARRSGGVTGPFSQDSAVLTSVWPAAQALGLATGPQHSPDQKFTYMTRAAVANGASGSHPAWDPV